MKFIHCADLHLDSPLKGLERYEGAPVEKMRHATRNAFINIINLALEKEVDFLLIAGDIFDGDWLDFNSGLAYMDQLRRLGDANILVFIVHGNHDAASRITRTVTFPRNVHVFPTGSATTVTNTNLGIAIHGQSYSTPAIYDDLASNFPDRIPNLLNIGLLHTSLAGAEGHEPYAPSSIPILSNKGYQYWALGHVHNRSILCEDPWVVFPGNSQGRNARELGEKGCMLVEYSPENVIQSVEFFPTDVARWSHIMVDVRQCDSLESLQQLIQKKVRDEMRDVIDMPFAFRMTIQGRTQLHSEIAKTPQGFRANVCSWLNEASEGMAWLEKIQLSISPPLDLNALAERDDPFGILIRLLNQLDAEPQVSQALTNSALESLISRIPHDLREEDSSFSLLSEDNQVKALTYARDILFAKISLDGEQ